MHLRVFLAVALLTGSAFAQESAPGEASDFRIAGIFSSDMVLQNNATSPIWGWSRPGAVVSIAVGEHQLETQTDQDGTWKTEIPPLPAGDVYSATLESLGHTITLENIAIGEVWLCSGQSNMEWPVRISNNPKEEIANANHPTIRLFHVPRAVANEPRHTVNAAWKRCTPESIPNFSAVGYYFGRELNQSLNVPIGLIQSAWGGTIAEAWTSGEALENLSDFHPKLDDFKAAAKEEAATLKNDPSAKKRNNPNVTTVLYNGMIAPLVPYAIKGATWYQGESNAGRPTQYRTLLPTMIEDWRSRFGVGKFPFLIVQLANFMDVDVVPVESNWAALREAQSLTADRDPKTGLAVTIDIGETKDIHPRNKQDVGYRLALHALAKTYDHSIPYSGPVYQSHSLENEGIHVSFDHTGDALSAGDGPLKGFSIAGKDQVFVWAEAKVVEGGVLVSSPRVPAPVAVRYGWADNPECNLLNSAGLPASPFRTDDW